MPDAILRPNDFREKEFDRVSRCTRAALEERARSLRNPSRQAHQTSTCRRLEVPPFVSSSVSDEAFGQLQPVPNILVREPARLICGTALRVRHRKGRNLSRVRSSVSTRRARTILLAKLPTDRILET